MKIPHKLSFKDYVISKNQLMDAIKQTPIQTSTYNVKKYCKLVIGESKNNKSSISFKPNNTIEVEWLYEDMDNPTPVSIIVDGDSHDIYWKGEKLTSWLSKNAIETF